MSSSKTLFDDLAENENSGCPVILRMDNGPEFITLAQADWTGNMLFQQGTVQRFLFGKALFQQRDVVRRGVVHKPTFYQAYSATTRIRGHVAWSGRSATASADTHVPAVWSAGTTRFR